MSFSNLQISSFFLKKLHSEAIIFKQRLSLSCGFTVFMTKKVLFCPKLLAISKKIRNLSRKPHRVMDIDASLLRGKLKEFFGYDYFKGDQEIVISCIPL